MNKLVKIILATLGGINTAFTIVIPIFVSFLILNTYSATLGSLNIQIILLAGILSSFYRAVRLWLV